MPLNEKNVCSLVPSLHYAVQGPLVSRAQRINEDIQKKRPVKYPFDRVVFLNVGNPQTTGNEPLTFPRQVLALLQSPKLLDHPDVGTMFPPDVVSRAKELMQGTGHTGGYTPPNGLLCVRENIAKYIEERDNRNSNQTLGVVNPANIFMTNGASQGILMMLRFLINDAKDGILIPIPQYPLYSAAIELYRGTLVPYYLDEERNWSLNLKHLQEIYDRTTDLQITPRALVVINPGNPTGSLLTAENQDEIIRFCMKNGLVLIADEVYQENIFSKKHKWHSFRERMLLQHTPTSDELQLCSLHSASKGMHGECGRRGGYMELINFPKQLDEALLKLPALEMCANITGQWLMELVVRPPKPGDASFTQYQQEYNLLFESYQHRAELVVNRINKIPGMRCLPVEGAFYIYARLDLPTTFIGEQKAAGKEPDEEWCRQLLEATGICTLPGSGFGQARGTYHWRTTILASTQLMESVMKDIEKFQRALLEKYSSKAKL